MSRESDNNLLRTYVEQGSEQAFAEIGRRYANLIFSTCLRETGDRTLAEDAAQGVALLLSQKAPTLLRHETLAGWLFTASRYVAANLRRREARRQVNEREAVERNLSSEAQESPLWEQIEPHFQEALNHLKPADREAILLRFFQGQSLAEVGESLGVPENTARMRVTRALERIRTHLGKAGIAVTISALALLCEESAVHAAPTSLALAFEGVAKSATLSAGLTQAVSLSARQWGQEILLKKIGAGFAVLVLLFAGVYWQTRPPRLSSKEKQRLFQESQGGWQGRLEFVDDNRRQNFTLQTKVDVQSTENGETLQFTATFVGSDREDITTFRTDPQTGEVSIQNGGPKSTHRLNCKGYWQRLSSGVVEFNGWDTTQREVRLRLDVRPNAFTMEETYRLSGAKEYRLRNRFTLFKQ